MANESMAGPGSLGRPDRMIDYGDDESGASKVPTIQEQLAEANRRLVEAQGELESMYDRNSPLGKTIKYIEEGGVPEIITNPEKREVLEKIHEEMARSLLSPVISLAGQVLFLKTGHYNTNGQQLPELEIRFELKPAFTNLIDQTRKKTQREKRKLNSESTFTMFTLLE